jgi:phage-related protein
MALAEIQVRFYRTSLGQEPVRIWLKELPKADRSLVGHELMKLQFGWPIGMPLVRPMSEGLWELRVSLTSNRIARLLFCFQDGELVALHAFLKKSMKTPQDELALARKRKREITK